MFFGVRDNPRRIPCYVYVACSSVLGFTPLRFAIEEVVDWERAGLKLLQPVSLLRQHKKTKESCYIHGNKEAKP